jgi:hypothetical protein
LTPLEKRLKPRTHILVSCAVVALLTAILTSAVIWSLGVAIRGDKFFDFFDNFSKRFINNEDYIAIFWILIFWGTLWLFWSILFYFHFRNSSAVVSRLTSWLLKGSVLELLIAVPATSSSAGDTTVPHQSPPASASPPAWPSCSSPLAPASSSST